MNSIADVKNIKRIRIVLIRAALVVGFIACLRALPFFSVFWQKCISLPALHGLAAIGKRIPFVILEWIFPVIAGMLVSSFFSKYARRICKFLLTSIAIAYIAVWFPLYFADTPAYSASTRQIATVCDDLINQLNASELDFNAIENLPAKYIRFPQWMDLLKISGLCSFISGEALISPNLPSVSQPFVATHEWMHLRGHAGEGAANIAAWEYCLHRGGTWANSARIWALRYCLGMLHSLDPELYASCLSRMNQQTLNFYLQAGGPHEPQTANTLPQRIYAALGIEAASDYEILALYLAAKCTE